MEENHILTMSKRICWVDWAKAIGISLVVWAHISPIARHEVFLFHMPFFFMISGLLFRQKGFLQELKGSAYSLALPYFIYNLLYMSPLPFGGARDMKTVINVILGNQEQLCYVMVPLWFLVALFVMRLVCSSPKIKLAYMGILDFALSVFFFGYFNIDQANDYFQLKTACFCLPFFVLGHYVKPLIKWCEDKTYMAILSVVLFVIGLVVGDFNSPNIEVNVFHCNYGSNILNYYFSTMILAISLLALIAYSFKTVHCRLIESISMGTLLILCLHLPIWWRIPQLVENALVMSVINMIVIFVVSYILIMQSERFLPCMIGKRKIK